MAKAAQQEIQVLWLILRLKIVFKLCKQVNTTVLETAQARNTGIMADDKNTEREIRCALNFNLSISQYQINRR